MSSIYVVESGAYLHKDGGCLLVENKSVKVKYPLESVGNIMLCSTAQISSELLQYLMRKNIPVVWLDGCGRYLGSVQTPSSIDIKKHLQQVRLLWKWTTYNEMAKKIIKAKTNSQIVVLRRYNRSATSEKVVAAIKAIYAIAKNIDKCEDYQKLMGYEGVISRKYYEGFSCLMPTEFQFEKRTRRPPKDEVNAMLSMGYSMLFNEILANANLCGLHPYIGFLHRIKEGHAALVSDLMEEWRTIIVDTTVLNMIKRQIIKKEMFRRENDGCFFTKEGLKIFLANYHKKLITDVEYLGNGATYRDLLKRQCQKYVSVVLNDKSEYYTAMEIR